MSERHGGPGGRWGGGPPPWWPEGEPFPPSGGWYGSGRRHRAPRFFVLLPFIFLAVFIAFVATIAWLGATFGAGPVVGAIVVGAILLGSGARAQTMLSKKLILPEIEPEDLTIPRTMFAARRGPIRRNEIKRETITSA